MSFEKKKESKNSFIEKIFSVKNQNKTHKVLTIFGVKMKFSRKISQKDIQIILKNQSNLLSNQNNLINNQSNLLSNQNNILNNQHNIQAMLNEQYKYLTSFDLRIQYQNLKKQKELSKKTIVLYLDYAILEPDTNAGDRASFSYLRALVKNNYIVQYLPYVIQQNLNNKYLDKLYELTGGGGIIINIMQKLTLEYTKEWLRLNGHLIDYVYINRPDVYNCYNELLRKYVKNAKFIYQGHDIHFLRLSRMLEIEHNEQIANFKENYQKIEPKIWKEVDTVLYFSDKEKEIVKSYVPDADVKVVPLFLYSDVEEINYNKTQREDLLFVGGFGHTPNVDAMVWFIDEIFPKILEKYPDIKLNIVGANCPNEVLDRAKQNNNIIVHGYLSDEDLNNLYNKTRIVISPLRYGAGVKGKIIEAMKNQIPVVTTSIGAEGINSDLLTIADDAQSFADAVCNLYNDNERLSKISEESYNFIKNNFSEEFIKELMNSIDEQKASKELQYN